MPIQPRAATLRVNSGLNSVWPRCGLNVLAAISARRNSRTSCCRLRAAAGSSSAEKSTCWNTGDPWLAPRFWRHARPAPLTRQFLAPVIERRRVEQALMVRYLTMNGRVNGRSWRYLPRTGGSCFEHDQRVGSDHASLPDEQRV